MALTFTSSTHSSSLPNKNLGLDPSSHFVAVEIDTGRNLEYFDPDGNHVGIDVKSLKSTNATSASSIGLNLASGKPMQLWVDYKASTDLLSVCLARLRMTKLPTHLHTSTINLSSFLADDIFVGFSASSGNATGSHYVLAWTFSMGGEAFQRINPDSLPEVPKFKLFHVRCSYILMEKPTKGDFAEFKLFGVMISVPKEHEGVTIDSRGGSPIQGSSQRRTLALRPGGDITKRCGHWTRDEHRMFLRGLEVLGKGTWTAISEQFVASRTTSQVTSHAQKYFLRKESPRHHSCLSLFDLQLGDHDDVVRISTKMERYPRQYTTKSDAAAIATAYLWQELKI